MGLRAGYKQTEVGVIPEDWEVAKIGDTKPFVTSGSRGWARYYSKYGNPFVRITNMTRERIYLDLDHLRYVKPPTGDAEGKRTSLQNDDILISITADIGICSFIDDSLEKPAFINQHIATVRFSSPQIFPKYVAYFIASDPVQRRFVSSADTGAKAGMNLDGIRSMEFALPPTKAEQTAIAEALSDVDALLAGLGRLIAKKRALKQAALHQLLTAKVRLPGFTGDWQVKRLGDVAEMDPENIGASTAQDYTFNYIALEDVNQGHLAGFSEQVLATAPSRARRKLRHGDLLVATVRPNLKSHLLFQERTGEWVCSTGFCVVRSHAGKSDPRFLFQHFFAQIINGQIEALIAGSNYPAINNRDVAALEIPVPPTIKEQTAIAAVLSDMDSEIAALARRLAKTRDLKQAMMQELLTGRTRLL